MLVFFLWKAALWNKNHWKLAPKGTPRTHKQGRTGPTAGPDVHQEEAGMEDASTVFQSVCFSEDLT